MYFIFCYVGDILLTCKPLPLMGRKTLCRVHYQTRLNALIFHQRRPITAQLFAYLLTDSLCHAYYTHATILRLSGFCLWQPGWASTRRNIHPLTPIVVINHPLSASSLMIHGIISVQFTCLSFSTVSKFSLVCLLALHPPLRTPYISSSSHSLLFAAHAHTIATCFAVVPRLCHLILVSQPFTWNSLLLLNTMPTICFVYILLNDWSATFIGGGGQGGYDPESQTELSWKHPPFSTFLRRWIIMPLG